MQRHAVLRRAFVWTLGLLAGLSPITFAEAITPQEQIQVNASRATSSLLLLRGEGFQKVHLQRLEADLAALAADMQGMKDNAELNQAHQALVTQLRNGVSYGPGDEHVPWRYPEDLSRSLRDFLAIARTLPRAQGDDSELAAKIEYLGVQYLARSYMGTFEIAREQPDTYLGQDERLLLPAIDAQLAPLDEKKDPQVAKLKTRWGYLRAALADMNSKSSALISVSGRPFAPITVDRHTRALTTQWMAMY